MVPPLLPIQHELYYDALTLMDEVLLPALSLAECNCCLAEEIWTVLRVYPYNHRYAGQGCQMAKFDRFLSLDCARVEGVGAQSKERKGSNFAA